ncbi:hypothetical protein B0E53_06956 [Micromonospora sp. MH33]|nr:hypothetical protein B0E53_06956 [Micromonospora sp. MH33]
MVRVEVRSSDRAGVGHTGTGGRRSGESARRERRNNDR